MNKGKEKWSTYLKIYEDGRNDSWNARIGMHLATERGCREQWRLRETMRSRNLRKMCEGMKRIEGTSF